MIYNTGRVNVTHGSNVVTGINTEFLKYVSSGAFFKIYGDTDFYVLQNVISNTEFTITNPYKGTTGTNLVYTITLDRTPNLGLPLINPNDPDSSRVVNIALSLIDKQAGDFLSFQTLDNIDYSGEGCFYIRNNYYSDELAIGRVVEVFDVSGELSCVDVIDDNKLYEASINSTPSTHTVSYDNETSGESSVAQWDVLWNVNRNNYAFVESIDVINNIVTYSGELKNNTAAWQDNDTIRVYGKTKGIAYISGESLTTTTVPLYAISGEALTLTEFKNGDYLYNYNRHNYRVITSGESQVVQTESSSDDWSDNDIVYTIRSQIKTELANLDSDIHSVKYGARSSIGTDAVKTEHIDFGFGNNQVDASDIPISVGGVSGETVHDAVSEVQANLTAHINTGEAAHPGGAITFSDDGATTYAISSNTVEEAINEIKARIDASAIIDGYVDYSTTNWQFKDVTFDQCATDFFNLNGSGEWYCRFQTGANAGELKQLQTFSPLSGEFSFTSGEAYTYTPVAGDKFRLFKIDFSRDEKVKVGNSGEIDYLNPTYFEQSTANHIRPVERIDDTSSATNKTWSASKISGEIQGIVQEGTTASNVGSGGVGVYKQKTGLDLEFKNINAGSTKITVTDDTDDNEVDIDVAVANLINDSGTTSSDLWSASKISGEISIKSDRSYVDDRFSGFVTTDENVKVGAAGEADYLNDSYFEQDAGNHIRTIERVDDTGIAADKLWSSTKISGEVSIKSDRSYVDDRFSTFSTTDELVKVGDAGTADYLNDSYFEQDAGNHVRPVERIDDTGTASDKTWSSDNISGEVSIKSDRAYVDTTFTKVPQRFTLSEWTASDGTYYADCKHHFNNRPLLYTCMSGESVVSPNIEFPDTDTLRVRWWSNTVTIEVVCLG